MLDFLLRWVYRANLSSRIRGGYRIETILEHMRTSVPIQINGYPPVYIDLTHRHWQEKQLFLRPASETWEYEPHVASALRTLVRPGDVAFDIGANLGLHTVLLQSLGAKVFCFEPNPKLIPNLKKTIAGLRPEAVLLPIALSDECGAAALFIPEGGHDMASFGQWKNAVGEFRCKMATLDSLNLPGPDFIKCDVEGAEVKVFRGGEKILSDPERAPIVIFEEHGGMTESLQVSKEAATTYLASLASKYEFFLINKETLRLEPSSGDRPYWCDVAAIPQCRAERLSVSGLS